MAKAAKAEVATGSAEEGNPALEAGRAQAVIQVLKAPKVFPGNVNRETA